MNVPVKLHLSPALARSTISERRITSRLFFCFENEIKGIISLLVPHLYIVLVHIICI